MYSARADRAYAQSVRMIFLRIPQEKMTFDKAIEFVLEEEGGYSSDPKDPGNWTVKGFKGELRGTNFGISALSYPKLDIKNLTKEDARSIYKQNYWTAARCDDFKPALAVALFDTVVNCGVSTGIMIMQRALGVVPDGKVGSKTINAAMKHGADRVPGMLAHRIDHYHKLCVKAPGMERFFLGWCKRVMRLGALCSQL